MQIKTSRWFGVIIPAALLLAAGNAWGFGIKPGSGNWGHAPLWGFIDHEPGDRDWSRSLYGEGWGGRWPEMLEAKFPERFDGGKIDEFRELVRGLVGKPTGGKGLHLGQDWDFSWSWIGQHQGLTGGWRDHDGLREFMLGDCRNDCGAYSGIADLRRGQLFDERDADKLTPSTVPSPVPLPASLLFFTSGLVGLAGFLRRSTKVKVHH